MKEKFIEKGGMLFMKWAPVLLEVNSIMPCIAQFVQDNSPLGRHNIHTIREEYLDSQYLIKDIEDEVLVDTKFIEAETNRLQEEKISDCLTSPTLTPIYVRDTYTQLEIIAKHCPEGSREWALWQMLNGKKVKHERDATNYYYMDKNGMLVSKGEQIIEDESRWLKTSSRNGWKIYEEPKPKLEVGKWYWNKVHKEYCYAIERDDDEVKMRSAGTLSTYFFDLMEVDDLVEASLEPDFSNAKVCDYAFSTIQGSETIGRIDVKDGSRKIINDCYEVDGRFAPLDEHPALFNSADQCAAYFAEVALKERGEE